MVRDEVKGLFVASREQADRPVGAEHQPRGAEGIEGGVEVGKELPLAPPTVIGLGQQAGELAVDVGTGGEPPQKGLPGLERAIPDGGLGEMVEDKGLPGEGLREDVYHIIDRSEIYNRAVPF